MRPPFPGGARTRLLLESGLPASIVHSLRSRKPISLDPMLTELVPLLAAAGGAISTEGMAKPGEFKGVNQKDVTDIRSMARLNLIFDTNVRQAYGFGQWKQGMTALSRCPNVTVKLGGVMIRLAAYDYGKSLRPATSEELARIWGPYVLTCIELFGPQRCMVESNFPVDKMGIGYAALFNALKRITTGLAADEKKFVFSGTADRVYRLGLTEGQKVCP